jgi:D-amino-acid dehydrogenase
MAEPVAVVGAGVIGVACARALQRAGRPVLLLDPALPGMLCSFGNAGHIAIEQIRPLARPDILGAVPRMLAAPRGPLTLRWRGVPELLPWLMRFAAATYPRRVAAGTTALSSLLGTALADWRAELDSAGLASLLQWNGALSVMETPQGVASAAAEGAILAEHGVRFEDLPGPETARRLPGLARVPAGGRYFPDAAHAVEPYRLVRDLAACFAGDGGEILQQPATGFRREGGRIAAVSTPSGERAVESIVLAAGLATASLGRMLGLSLPLTAERGYHAMLPLDSLPVPLPVSFAERGFVITPMEHGIRLAGTVEFGAVRRAPDWDRAEILVEHARQLFGRSPDATARWQGDRPTLPDYLPAIGRASQIGNLVVAAGHQHLGLTLAATTGRIVASLLSGQDPGIDLRPFDPARFGMGTMAPNGQLSGRKPDAGPSPATGDFIQSTRTAETETKGTAQWANR